MDLRNACGDLLYEPEVQSRNLIRTENFGSFPYSCFVVNLKKKNRLLRYNPHGMQFTHLECIIQQFLMYCAYEEPSPI